MPVPAMRVRRCNEAPIRADRSFVLYWMVTTRRIRDNYALDRAIEHAGDLGKPLLVLEALRCGYPHASDRLHQFVLDGMRDNDASLRGTGIGYYPYVEPAPGAGAGLIAELSRAACVMVTDEYPSSFVPRMVAAAARQIGVRLEAVDSNGLLPLSAAERAFARAHDFRRMLQKRLPSHLGDRPRSRRPVRVRLPPFGRLPRGIVQRWPRAERAWLERSGRSLRRLPIDHAVETTGLTGGSGAAETLLRSFVRHRLPRYGERHEPSAPHTSGLSPYLHFGHIGSHRILAAIARHEGWSAAALASRADGARAGWWGMSAQSEGFLDQLVTWRELAFNFAFHRADHTDYEALPSWARSTLDAHARDPRPFLYDLEAFEEAATHDALWNAAQQQLRQAGVIHTYLRMLWGKKIVHWAEHPRRALEIMIALNDRYAIDGRDPNSYSGIGWVLGRFDRAWGPERPVFGKVRYMSSRATRRKLRVQPYIERWCPPLT